MVTCRALPLSGVGFVYASAAVVAPALVRDLKITLLNAGRPLVRPEMAINRVASSETQ
jgi:hypothetical protein